MKLIVPNKYFHYKHCNILKEEKKVMEKKEATGATQV